MNNMITGNRMKENMIEGIVDAEVQTQANGFDMTLQKVEGFRTENFGTLDFDNIKRRKPIVSVIPFDQDGRVRLLRGSYLITLDPKMNIPKNQMWLLKPRSSLVRMGAFIDSGVFDAGFIGRGQVLLTVTCLHGIELYKDARVAQMIGFEGEQTEGYNGIYQEK